MDSLASWIIERGHEDDDRVIAGTAARVLPCVSGEFEEEGWEGQSFLTRFGCLFIADSQSFAQSGKFERN